MEAEGVTKCRDKGVVVVVSEKNHGEKLKENVGCTAKSAFHPHIHKKTKLRRR